MATQKIVVNEKLKRVWDKIFLYLDCNIHKTISQQESFQRNMIQNDSSLTKNEKKFLLDDLQKVYDKHKINNNFVEKQQCNNCQNWHQATQYCEFCIFKYLENNFVNWTSENNEIDKLIQGCQQKIISPRYVIEWINYDQFENVEHLMEGGCATIYTAKWKDGCYKKWNSENQILERFGRQKVILKRLNNSKNSNVHWFQEVTLSFTLDNTFQRLVVCHGLTKDPSTNDYMLVLRCYDDDLRHFIKDNYHTLTLLKKYKIICNITHSLVKIHSQDIVHRDLHSGNILYYAPNSHWSISDLGLSGPVDKPLNSIYGNLPYIAPEVYCGQIYTKKSDIYSIGILMWEVITGETPFGDQEHDRDLAFAITEGYRPWINENIPFEYATLIKQCWDADPDNRPDANIIFDKMTLLIKSLYEEMDKQQQKQSIKNFKSKIKNFFKSGFTRNKDKQIIKNTQSNERRSKIYKIQTSKVYTFNFSIQPRNATDEEEQAYKTNQFDFEISEEMEQLYLKAIGADNSNKSCVDREYEFAGPSNSSTRCQN
ncbi:hypothetical protein Glove_103g272 [Diversispora epigaea]|uniref:Protein kinase domain-containing protein n=1 Tax=Diversispora epigaea TaxID=1348612 RepID=A0A397J392_9GLOM|nr:hypothetical protein Glove_103g272 [Diversispora epigaea]